MKLVIAAVIIVALTNIIQEMRLNEIESRIEALENK